MKIYVAPRVSVEDLLPDTAVSSSPSYCVGCENTTGKTYGGDLIAADYQASTQQFVIIGDYYYTCILKIEGV